MIATPCQRPDGMTTCRPLLLPLLAALMLLAGCSVDQQRLPAPVEQRSLATPGVAGVSGVPGSASSQATVTPQPDYTPNTLSDAEAAATAAPTAASKPPHDATTTALVSRANEQAAGGQYQAAAGSIERAIRIAPDDAELWYDLARIRLRQGELDEAEELAVKSRSMAAGQPALQARNWRLVAVVRQQRNDPDGAEQALETARKLENKL